MKTIGLIGGMSFESTAVYYRMINEMVREHIGGLASADVLLHSVNFAEIVALQKAGRWDLAAEALTHSARRLQDAGADCVLICTNTMHLVAPEVAKGIDVPLIHIIDETAKALSEKGLKRPLLLATRYTMEHGFYAERMRAAGIEVMVPDAEERGAMHDIIFDELCAGVVKPGSRERAIAMIESAKRHGADSIILGCTEICLLLDPRDLPLPGIDSTAVHACAAVRFAMADQPASRAAA